MLRWKNIPKGACSLGVQLSLNPYLFNHVHVGANLVFARGVGLFWREMSSISPTRSDDRTLRNCPEVRGNEMLRISNGRNCRFSSENTFWGHELRVGSLLSPALRADALEGQFSGVDGEVIFFCQCAQHGVGIRQGHVEDLAALRAAEVQVRFVQADMFILLDALHHHHRDQPELLEQVQGAVDGGKVEIRQDVSGIITRLLGEQLADGGWNCEAEFGSTRASFNTTICVLDALLQTERTFGAQPAVTAARKGGEEYLLERHLMRRKSTGEVITQDRMHGAVWSNFAFPTWWHYDILRGLDYLRSAGVQPDERVQEAVELVLSKRQPDGRWLLDRLYPRVMLLDLGEREGEPSRWITLRALRVLNWYFDHAAA